MPTAAELRALFDDHARLDRFITKLVEHVETVAKYGERELYFTIPDGLVRVRVEFEIKATFPECKLRSHWFTRHYTLSWA